MSFTFYSNKSIVCAVLHAQIVGKLKDYIFILFSDRLNITIFYFSRYGLKLAHTRLFIRLKGLFYYQEQYRRGNFEITKKIPDINSEKTNRMFNLWTRQKEYSILNVKAIVKDPNRIVWIRMCSWSQWKNMHSLVITILKRLKQQFFQKYAGKRIACNDENGTHRITKLVNEQFDTLSHKYEFINP